MKSIPVESGYLESFDKTKIYYELRGEGDLIVFVYGIACLINHWHYQIEYFSQSHTTLAYDLRGHHKSSTPAEQDQLTMEALAKDLALLLARTGTHSAHVVSHSFGTQISLKTYEMYPELFKSLTFINGFAKNPIKGMFGLDVVEKLFYLAKTQYSMIPGVWDWAWKKSVNNPVSHYLSALAGGFNLRHTHIKDIQIYARGVAAMDLAIFIRLFEELMEFDGEDILPKIRVPCLIISGERDGVTPRHYQERMRDMVPGSEFMIVPAGSHCTQLDFPEFINLRLEKFFKDQ